MKISAVRTPEARFAELPEFAYAPHYVESLAGFEGLRLHYVDEGRKDADRVFLCLHGEPTWSYLYRKMIPVFVESGARVIAPDFFGFGRSDKPTDDAVYTYDFHRRSLTAFIESLELESITLVCQDWGGILGLSLPVDFPKLISRLIVMNTALPTGDFDPGPGFRAWRDFVASSPDFDVGGLMTRSEPGLSRAEAAAYEAPFPDPSYKAGVRRFPAIVPITADMEGAEVAKRAAKWWMNEWSGPSFMAIGERDPVLGLPAMRALRKVIRGCPEPLLLPEAGHFVQESGDVIARAALAAFGD